MPLYHHETILQRIGVDIPRATLANWVIKEGQLVQPLINLLRDQLLAHDLIQRDETRVQVLKESGKAAQSKSYLWLQHGGPPGQPVVYHNKMEMMSRRAYGFRNFENYRLRVLTHCGWDGIINRV